MSETQDLLKPLASVGRLNASTVGHKAANLGELGQAGIPVPAGLVLTDAALDAFLEHNLEHSGGRSAADLIRDGEFPPAIEQALSTAAAELRVPLAVRSSGLREDTADASFAGMYETVLHVENEAALKDAIRQCWTSAFGSRATAYEGEEHDAPRMAVLVQEQLTPTAAGAAFSAHPLTGERDCVIVNTVAGLADGLMHGEVTPETWTVRERPTREGNGTAVLDESGALEVAELARKAESLFGRPQDIEWAITTDGLFALQSRPITALPDAPIPVEIQPPDGAYWERDEHLGRPETLVFSSLLRPAMLESVAAELQRYGIPLEGIKYEMVAHWCYTRVVPLGGKERPPPPAWVLWLAARLAPPLIKAKRQVEQAFGEDVAGQEIEHWVREGRAALRARIEPLARADIDTLDDEQLGVHVEEVLSLGLHAGALHGRLTLANQMNVGLFGLACEDILGWEFARLVRLLDGSSLRTRSWCADTAAVIDQLEPGDAARTVIAEGGPSAIDRARAASPAFREVFDEWMAVEGKRLLGYDLDEPTLAECPGLLLSAMQRAIGAEPPTFSDGEGAREEARAWVREHKPDQLALFEKRLAQGLAAWAVRDDNGVECVSLCLGLVRRALLAVGRRWVAAGRVDRPDDILYLAIEETREAMRKPELEIVERVRRRRGEQAWARQHPPPPYFGTKHAQPSWQLFPEPLGTMFRLLGWTPQHTRQDALAGDADPDQGLKGTPVSPGHVTGVARVVNGIDELHRVGKGDILVCQITTPSWAIAFGNIAGLVTEEGGLLTHPSIVAREFGIPGVVGVKGARERIPDGAMVSVDGDSGMVTVLD